MAVYFEKQINFDVPSSIHTDIEWHNLFPVLSVASYNDDRGGFVSLYTDEGIKVNANFPSHLNSQISCVSWHPGRKILAIALENGDLLTWNDHDDDVFQPDIQHKGPICAVQWSTLGSRLVSTDGSGGMICWKADTRGQLKMVFHHELKDPLTEVVFRTVSQPKQAVDISGLARAAVSGDEQALDLFSSWPAKTSISRITLGNEKKENLNFFVGSTTGVVYYMNENGSCTDVIHLDGGIKQLLYHENHDLLVVITDGLILSQYQVDEDGAVTEMTKVKLMGRSMEANVIWAGRGILAVTTGENLIRIWDLDMGDNYVLTLEGSHFHDTAEVITCIDFNESKGILAGGTNRGNIALWRYLGDNSAAIRKDSEKSWKLQSPSNVQGAIKHIKWGSSLGLLAVNTVRDLYILNEHIMSFHFKDQVSAVQISPSQLVIDLFANKQQTQLKTDLQIHGVYVMVDHIAVWNRKKVAIYEISENGRLIASGCFSANTNVVALLEHSVYTFEDGKVQVRTFQGTVKQSLAFLEDEGQPLCMDICGTFLVVGTTEGFIKIWDISRREAKLQANPKSLSQVIPNFGHIVSAKCNCTGTKVSIISTLVSNSPNYKLYIWDLETDIIQYFNFSSGKPEQDDDEETSLLNKESELSASERARSEIAHEVAGHYPISHFWDPEENHQLVCEAALLPVDLQNGEKPIYSDEVKNQDILVVSLLVMPESGILVQETFYLENSYSTLLGIHIPYYYLLKKLDDCESSRKSPTLNNKQDKNHQSKLSGYVIQKTIRDFVGLEESDKATRQAMMSFSYYLTIGNMDEAFKAIKSIKSGSVWENMAKMCVKTKRLDVASVCLGNMGHGRGARALREAMKEPELDAQVAMLAVQLGLNEEAEKLYRSCGRYDLLNQFYQGCGLWKKALEIAESHDRIHLRTTFYNYAKHLESAGDITMAIQSYEKSDTHRFEVPRMLFDEPQALEEYISRSKDKVLQKWWAQYMESTGEMETALFCYELAQDYLSLVRVYCYCNNLEKAAEIANETGDKAACYHLGRQFENREDIKEAIHFYTRAQAYSNAIRLCKEQNMEEQLLNLALMGNEQEMIDVASYYENKQGHEEKAIMLYHKGGMFGKAVDLAFRTRQYSALHQIANDLNECTDPQLLQRCAQFFVENSQFDKAVDLLAVGKKYIEALDLCVEHSLPITEELAEKLTPPKNETENGLRIRILEKVAESCYQQDNYHLATKKFTQAGNKIKAMKALLKSGDTDKIVFFANVSRQKEIYIMAANYLQSLNWRKDPDIMKNIIGFYSKGRALDLLAGFYDACAQVEIDEFQNYEKAFEALNEASKCLSKAKTHPHYEQKMAQLQMKLELVKKFVHIRRMYEDDPTEAMRLCQNLLSDPDLEIGIRKGDVYGFMVEHYSRIKNHKAAYNLIEEMRSKMPNTNIAFYVNMKTIETIYQSLDIPLNNSPFDKNKAILRQGPSGDDDVEEEVEEVVSADMLGRKELLKSESLQL